MKTMKAIVIAAIVAALVTAPASATHKLIAKPTTPPVTIIVPCPGFAIQQLAACIAAHEYSPNDCWGMFLRWCPNGL
jgi:hypothetical protein